MPVPLPAAPMCPTPLPAQPHDPPTLGDIADAIKYNRNIRISHQGMLLHISPTHLLNSCSHLTAPHGASKADVARGAVYEAALIEANAGIGSCVFPKDALI
jgi:hypothetical protein